MEPIAHILEKTRKTLGMSRVQLAERSGVPRSAVNKIMTGKASRPEKQVMVAIARALGVEIGSGMEILGVDPQFLFKQAQAKAEKLMKIVQGTSRLEGQGIPFEEFEKMKQETTTELLLGSKRSIWG